MTRKHRCRVGSSVDSSPIDRVPEPGLAAESQLVTKRTRPRQVQAGWLGPTEGCRPAALDPLTSKGNCSLAVVGSDSRGTGCDVNLIVRLADGGRVALPIGGCFECATMVSAPRTWQRHPTATIRRVLDSLFFRGRCHGEPDARHPAVPPYARRTLVVLAPDSPTRGAPGGHWVLPEVATRTLPPFPCCDPDGQSTGHRSSHPAVGPLPPPVLAPRSEGQEPMRARRIRRHWIDPSALCARGRPRVTVRAPNEEGVSDRGKSAYARSGDIARATGLP
jgi:hypothetical protein